MARILIVEDEPYERRALSSFIRQAGHEIVGEAATAREGIELATLHHPRIVFIDIRLPEGVDGLDCAKTILERVPHTIIIIITAYAEFDYARRALEMGVFSYMLKPVSPEEISQKIAELEQKFIKKSPSVVKKNIDAAVQAPLPDTILWEKSVLDAKAYIDKHFYEPLKIQDLSSMFFLSPAYLTRLFRQRVGFSIKQYLQIVRLSAAAKALLTSNASVKAIACAVGYNDANYFSIAFHKHFGLTPSAYRLKYKTRNYKVRRKGEV
ncbi:MAG: response regulator [Bacillota bacterium]